MRLPRSSRGFVQRVSRVEARGRPFCVPTGRLLSLMRLPAPPDLTPFARCVMHVALAGCLSTAPLTAMAVSGGGKDFSGASIEGQDFSGQKLTGKEFRGSRGANAIFKGAALQSTSFFQADLSKASFDGADLTGASLEEAGLDGVSFNNAVMTSAYLTRTILDAADITGADFTDAIMPEKTLKSLCAREDAKGVNPQTKVDTRDSLMCPE